MINVHTIFCRWGTMDNYSYLVVDNNTGISAIIDPSETKPIIKKCSELNIKPDYILNTHHHFDHVEGNCELKKLYNAKVVGSDDRCPCMDIKVKDGDTFILGKSKAQIIDVSAHTQGHILYYFPPTFPPLILGEETIPSHSPFKGERRGGGDLFTGDTLFNLCIGGLFEGTPEQMFASLEKIKKLPDDTLFYPGHEYTLYSVKDALAFSPNNQDLVEYIKLAQEKLAKGLPVHPVSLGLEKKSNPYLIANTLQEFKSLF